MWLRSDVFLHREGLLLPMNLELLEPRLSQTAMMVHSVAAIVTAFDTIMPQTGTSTPIKPTAAAIDPPIVIEYPTLPPSGPIGPG